MVKLMDREDKITAIWIVVAWAVLIMAMCIWPDFFTQQLFESTAAHHRGHDGRVIFLAGIREEAARQVRVVNA